MRLDPLETCHPLTGAVRAITPSLLSETYLSPRTIWDADRLSALADIVFLTNLPGTWNEAARGRTLARAGMDYPLVTNSGPKGTAAARLAAGRRAPVVFVDDSPLNLRSVAASLAGCTLIQFIADARFLASAEDIDGVGLKTDDWNLAEAYISQVVGG